MPPLMEPRKSWNLKSFPQYFDTLNFYKYITKSRLINGADAKKLLSDYYSSQNLPINDFKVYFLKTKNA